jgi:hypothetical protein
LTLVWEFFWSGYILAVPKITVDCAVLINTAR